MTSGRGRSGRRRPSLRRRKGSRHITSSSSIGQQTVMMRARYSFPHFNLPRGGANRHEPEQSIPAVAGSHARRPFRGFARGRATPPRRRCTASAFYLNCPPMSYRLTRVLLILLLCTLPVQSMAAALSALTCGPHENRESATAHAGVTHAEAALHDHGTSGGDGVAYEHSGDEHAHLCCHQFSSGTPSVVMLPAPREFTAYTQAVPPLTPSHIPDLPQRPPRA